MKRFLIIVIADVLICTTALAAVLVTSTVGLVQDQVITSREVQMNYFLERALFPNRKKSNPSQLLKIDSKTFSQEVSRVLLEWVVFLESQNFPASKASKSEIATAENSAMKILSSIKVWQKLDVSGLELRENIIRKLQSKKFIHFKADSSVVPVTDGEAKNYFRKNRKKFGTMPFENFKENIKTYLARQQVDRRLKDWFEVLQKKYKVRTLAYRAKS